MSQFSSGQDESACYVEDELCSNPAVRRPLQEVIARRANRRDVLKLAVAATAGGALGRLSNAAESVDRSPPRGPSTLTFSELPHGNDEHAHVAAGYDMQVLLRWGDPLSLDAPAFDPRDATASSQRQQFGYNCDYISFLPLPRDSRRKDRGLLCVNHEYTDTNLMFPGIASRADLETLSKEQVDVELAAHGHSVVEIRRTDRGWEVVTDSSFNRRITALDTKCKISGPAAGHVRLRTSADPTGTLAIGTLNNCAGGVTPWGTVLICEENFNNYFSGSAEKTSEARNHRRYGIDGPSRFNPAWARHHSRFDIEQEPHEPNRFGWVVEFDPYDPHSIPVKRTALGRCKHEGAGIVLNRDGRVVVYCGDDEQFDYVYKFVSRRAYDPDNRAANRNLLDDGTLHVARFDDDGTVHWLPLIFGRGPLTAANDFNSQAGVLIETRRAADLLGATPMDRPEDIEPSPVSGHVFVILTNNTKRKDDQTSSANPRAENAHGHILELIPPTRGDAVDHAADRFQWEVFLQAGNPADVRDRSSYHAGISPSGWFSSPDNGTFDSAGRLWLTTDSDHERTGFGDGVYACDAQGAGRALTKLFFRGPRGSEVSGVCLSPDDETLFISVQHPAEEPDSDFQKPTTRWPDFQPDLPPRPSVVAITRRGGGRIGA